MKEIDPLFLEIMRRIARGEEESPWKLDKRYPIKGSPEERYTAKRGDKQALLWEIFLAADEGREIKSWAVPEIRYLMYRLLIGAVRDWNDEFGTPLARKNNKKGPDSKRGVQARTLGKMAKMVPLWKRVQEAKVNGDSVNEDLMGELAREFGITFDEAWDLYSRMNNFMKKYLADQVVPGRRG
jgi:hypothetical protein